MGVRREREREKERESESESESERDRARARARKAKICRIKASNVLADTIVVYDTVFDVAWHMYRSCPGLGNKRVSQRV